MNDEEKKLSELHNSLTNKLLERLQDPEVKASDLNVARQFLKDNGIECQPIDNNSISRLAQELPFALDDVLDASKDVKN